MYFIILHHLVAIHTRDDSAVTRYVYLRLSASRVYMRGSINSYTLNITSDSPFLSKKYSLFYQTKQTCRSTDSQIVKKVNVRILTQHTSWHCSNNIEYPVIQITN